MVSGALRGVRDVVRLASEKLTLFWPRGPSRVTLHPSSVGKTCIPQPRDTLRMVLALHNGRQAAFTAAASICVRSPVDVAWQCRVQGAEIACLSSVEESDMDPRDEIAPPQASIQETARLAARRRLLRGSFGVPAVLTLSSGAALAAASSPIRCFNNAPTNTTDVQKTNFAVPQYLVNSVGVSGAQPLFNVVYADSLIDISNASNAWVVKIAVPGTFTAGKLVRVDTFSAFAVSDLTVGQEVAATSSGTVAPRFTLTSESETNPVLTVSGLIPTGTTGSASGSGRIITTSCWTSFK